MATSFDLNRLDITVEEGLSGGGGMLEIVVRRDGVSVVSQIV